MILVGAWLFVVIHIDTLIALVAFCSDDDYRSWEVALGHYAGFLLVLGGALLSTLALSDLLHEHAFLLGIVPIMIGGWMFLRTRSRAPCADTVRISSGGSRIVIVTLTGVGLGGENLAVLVPFFLTLSLVELVVIVAMYFVGAGIVFFLAFAVARRTVAVGLPNWIDRWIVPSTLILVGAFVLTTGATV